MKKDTGGSAFPCAVFVGEGGGVVVNGEIDMGGMTLRDYAAIKLMAALVNGCVTAGHSWNPEDAAKDSLRMADAFIAERNK